jgi:hypothetical protein
MRKQWVLALIVTAALLAGGVMPVAGGASPRQASNWQLAGAVDIEPAFFEAVVAAYPEYDQGATAEPRYDGRMRAMLLSPVEDTVMAFVELNRSDTGQRDRLVCRYELSLGSVTCRIIDPPEAAFLDSPLYAAWSPDGRTIALHEDVFIRVFDGDIWALDVETLTFTNRTDDEHYGRAFPDAGTPVPSDYAPLWNPVTGDLYFFRTARQGDVRTMGLYRLPGGSGEAELVLDLKQDARRFAIESWVRTALSPDGTRIALIPYSVEQPRNIGVWMIDLGARTLTQIVTSQALQVGLPDWALPDFQEMVDEGNALWPFQIAWGARDTLIVRVLNPLFFEPFTINTLAIDAVSGAVTPLTDYNQFKSEEALMDAASGSEEPGNRFLAEVALIAPDGGSLFYFPRQFGRTEQPPVYAIPIPFAGEPVMIGALPDTEAVGPMKRARLGERGREMWQLNANGRALVGTVLLTFQAD